MSSSFTVTSTLRNLLTDAAHDDSELLDTVVTTQPPSVARVGIEAAVRQGWDRWLMGERGSEKKSAFVGMDSFGASAPYKTLYEHFGITAEAVADKAKGLL